MCSSRCSATFTLPFLRHFSATEDASPRADRLSEAAKKIARRSAASPFALCRPDHTEEIPTVMDLTPLVGRPLEVAGDGGLQALVVVRDYQLHALKPAGLQ